MAVRAFIKRFNKKLYDSNDPNETNWSRWYFPLINTDKSLKELDAYMQDCLRYTASETHTKARAYLEMYQFVVDNLAYAKQDPVLN